MNVNNFRFGEVLAQRREIGVGNVVRRAREFLDVREGGAFFFAVTRIIPGFEGRPVVRRKTDPLRRRQVVLSAVVASIDERDANVDEFVELAIQGTPDAGVEGKKFLSISGRCASAF